MFNLLEKLGTELRRNLGTWAVCGSADCKRMQRAVLFVLLLAFSWVRWRERLEPWSSDDLELFQISAQAASGQHWLFGSPQAGTVSHQALRIGLLPVSLPVIRAFGACSTAYYLVPLLFALLGSGILYWIALRYFGLAVAVALGLIHLAWPWELRHASVFLTDLPAAVTALACLCCLDQSGRHGAQTNGSRKSTLWAVCAGLCALESQLLRNNSLVLMAPAVLVLFAAAATRVSVLKAAAVTSLGMLLFEALLAYRGLGWGYDWRRVHAALAEYSPFLPTYSWHDFMLREFDYQRKAFGWEGVGIAAEVLLIASLAGHALLLVFERRPLLCAIAAFGLFSWLVFSFSIYERVPGGVRALAPTNFRYMQPFAYSSLVVWGWVGYMSYARWRAPFLGGALAMLLLCFCWVTLRSMPSRYVGGGLEHLVHAIERHTSGPEPLRIAGMPFSLGVPRLFCCGSSSPVEWRDLELRELLNEVVSGDVELVLRNRPRERSLMRYDSEARRLEEGRQFKQLERELRKRAKLDYSDKTHALFELVKTSAPTAR